MTTVPTKGKFVSDRTIANIFLRPDDKMCSFGAWHYLLSQAAFRDHQTNYKGRFITIKRGDIPTTYRKLAEIFNWSVGKVQRFIENAALAGHIITSVDTGFLIITICNYDEIQSFQSKRDTLTNTKTETETDSHTDTTTDTNRTNKTHKTNKTGGSSAPRADAHASLPRWQIVLKKELGEAVFKSWIKPLYYRDGYVYCPSRFAMDWCKDHYKDHIEKSLASIGERVKGFEVNNSDKKEVHDESAA